MSKSSSLKRIQADIRELAADPSDQYCAAPLEDNMFEWHFTIRGPPDTEFEGGCYHGRIILPFDYPFKPPDIIFTTPNGRFQANAKVCLSISAYHPEFWQPAWGVRLILEALISFLPTPADGAIGSLSWTKTERRRLAKLSRNYRCGYCGNTAQLLPKLKNAGKSEGSTKFKDEISKLHMQQLTAHSLPPKCMTTDGEKKDREGIDEGKSRETGADGDENLAATKGAGCGLEAGGAEGKPPKCWSASSPPDGPTRGDASDKKSTVGEGPPEQLTAIPVLSAASTGTPAQQATAPLPAATVQMQPADVVVDDASLNQSSAVDPVNVVLVLIVIYVGFVLFQKIRSVSIDISSADEF
eukprot:CAMPEP_0194326888 /NCGR_PEP_ID=MMETSP0171-20130528/38760_1 /TAXON_ID=218684 /ORGANISM="Corethron pennatum, Strain L29A3" /LENGTH=354 /DNA_ID=CAMNT_0039086641 /DNA_START=5 /DNA_END=1069 /DNA_ORIENTATION=+